MATTEGGKQQPIARQTSVYALTLDEFQNTLGEKNFASMNMDEFLKNIWTAEESQAMAAAIASSSGGGGGESGGLFRQPSLPRTLSTKTVDEVWKDIHKSSDTTSNKKEPQQRQMTMGEMTLEDFLIKAGVVREDGGVQDNKLTTEPDDPAAANLSLSVANQQQADWLMTNQFPSLQQQQQQQQFLHQQAEVAAYVTAAKAMGNGGPALNGPLVGGNLAIGLGMNGLGTPQSPSSDSQGNNGYGLGFGFDGRGRKRTGMDGPVEVVLERRQRRMIKNRESAARSRARKQAYTVELEAEVTHLKEENMKLRQQQEEAENRDRKRTQILEIIEAKEQANLSKPKPLRRTQTGPW